MPLPQSPSFPAGGGGRCHSPRIFRWWDERYYHRFGFFWQPQDEGFLRNQELPCKSLAALEQLAVVPSARPTYMKRCAHTRGAPCQGLRVFVVRREGFPRRLRRRLWGSLRSPRNRPRFVRGAREDARARECPLDTHAYGSNPCAFLRIRKEPLVRGSDHSWCGVRDSRAASGDARGVRCAHPATGHRPKARPSRGRSGP